MSRIYLDTNVYLDYLLDRNKGKTHSESAFNIFKRTIQCEFNIVISDHLLFELRRHVDPDKTKVLFYLINNKIIKIRESPSDIAVAEGIDAPTDDARHIVLAKKAGAEVIVTRNIKDFKDLCDAKLPEDV